MTPNQAEELLAEIQSDPRGHSPMDLHKLLQFFGFTAETRMEDQQGCDVRLRYHPDHPDLHVLLYSGEAAHQSAARRTAQVIDILRSRTR